MPMRYIAAVHLSPRLLPVIVAGLCLAFRPCFAAEEAGTPKGAAVTVLQAAKQCLSNIVEVSGTVVPREQNFVRPERPGLKVAEVLADPGDTVTAGQTLARLNLPEGGSTMVQGPGGRLVASSSAVVGAVASGRGEALFTISARSEFDLVGLVPTQDVTKLAVNQPANMRIIG